MVIFIWVFIFMFGEVSQAGEIQPAVLSAARLKEYFPAERLQSGSLLKLGTEKELLVFKEARKYATKNSDGDWILRNSRPKVLLKYDSFFSGLKFNPMLERRYKLSRVTNQKIIFFHTHLQGLYTESLKKIGVKFIHFIPKQAVLAIVEDNLVEKVKSLAFVDRVENYLPIYKLDISVLEKLSLGKAKGVKTYILTPFGKESVSHLKSILDEKKINWHGDYYLRADLDLKNLLELVQSSATQWIEESSLPENDEALYFVGGGINGVQELIPEGLTGVGIRGHSLESVFPDHPELAANEHRGKPIRIGEKIKATSSHGQRSFGILFALGLEPEKAKGILPNAQGLYSSLKLVTSEGGEKEGSRYALNKKLLEEHEVMFQTASWGYSPTEDYNAHSAEMDDIIFHLDMPITQSQSNQGSKLSRPQAWAKNIISVGAIRSQGTVEMSDDTWHGGSSIGPASDGRIKPDIVGYYDPVPTITGESEYGVYCCTSSATPTIAGFVGLIIEMWTKGYLGEERLKYPMAEVFDNRPRAMTTKALLINSAVQYKFKGEDHDLTRVHQGWGFPNIKKLFERKDKLLVDNEQTSLKDGEKKIYRIRVKQDESLLKVTLAYKEPAAPVPSERQLLNDLNLKVVSPSGKVYLGNMGLLKGRWSKSNGVADSVNNVENVFLKNPRPGIWQIIIDAAEINVDSNLETPDEIDSVFALVASGGAPL